MFNALTYTVVKDISDPTRHSEPYVNGVLMGLLLAKSVRRKEIDELHILIGETNKQLKEIQKGEK